MNVIIDEPESKLLDCLESRSCEEIMELEILKNVDQVIIKENDHRMGEGKRYIVTDNQDNKEYFQIHQDTPCQFSLREINEKIRLVNFNLPVRTSCICPCGQSCRLKSRVILQPNTLVGLVEQTLNWCQPYFNVYDTSGECILRIDGSFAMMCFTIGRHRVTNTNGQVVGDILISYSSHSGGFHNILLKFTKNMDISTKLMLIGAGLMFSNAQASRG